MAYRSRTLPEPTLDSFTTVRLPRSPAGPADPDGRCLVGILSAALLSPFLMRVALVYHCRQTTRRLDDALAEAGALVERFHLESGDPRARAGLRPRRASWAGAMGAYDVDFHPWLEDEKEWIRGPGRVRGPGSRDLPRVPSCWPTLSGGTAFKADRPEVGLVPISLTAGRRRSTPVVSMAGPMVYALHQDSFVLPPDATLLAHTDRFPHAFRSGSVLALQFHPDADLDLALAWGKEDHVDAGGGRGRLRGLRAGVDPGRSRTRSRFAGDLHCLAAT